MGVRARAAVVGLASLGLVVALLAVLASEAAAQSALLSPISVRVSVDRQNETVDVAGERVVYSGDRVRTDVTGQALITYRDGSTVVLDRDSELVIEYIGTEDGDLVIRMSQTLGRAWYSISHSLSWRGRYEVHTAAMASVIRAGSGEYVAVDAEGSTMIVATAGAVQATGAGVSVTLAAGSATTVRPGAAPSSPEPAPIAPTPSALPSPAASATPTPAPSPSEAPAPTSVPTLSPLPSPAPTATSVPIATPLPSATPLPVATPTFKPTPAPTGIVLPLPSATRSPSATPQPTVTLPPAVLPTPTFAPLPTVTLAPLNSVP